MIPYTTAIITLILATLDLHYQTIVIPLLHPGRGTQYNTPYGDVPPYWKAKSASWYINGPLFYAKFEWANYSFLVFI